MTLGVKGMPQSEKKQRILNGPVVGAFNGYSEQLITSNATHLVEKGNSFYNKTIQGQNNSSTSQYTSFGPNSMNPTKELSYVQYTQMHNKRISVVRSKCPPTNPKVTYSKLYTLKSQSYVKNPYIGPQHSESRLKLIN